MTELSVSVLGSALATPFGTSIEVNCDALFRGADTFRTPQHFDSKGRLLGIDPELDQPIGRSESRAVTLLMKLRDALPFRIPAEDTMLFLSTTVGSASFS